MVQAMEIVRRTGTGFRGENRVRRYAPILMRAARRCGAGARDGQGVYAV